MSVSNEIRKQIRESQIEGWTPRKIYLSKNLVAQLVNEISWQYYYSTQNLGAALLKLSEVKEDISDKSSGSYLGLEIRLVDRPSVIFVGHDANMTGYCHGAGKVKYSFAHSTI